MTGSNKEMYSSGEVARLCGVSLRTVLNWIAKGWLEAHQLPGARGDNRIMRGDLIAFMNAHKMPLPDIFQPTLRSALVVDDEIPMANAIKRILRGKGFEVSVANDGFSAGLFYASQKPALMTLDLQMPTMDGFQVLEKVAAEKCGKIVVISGLDKQALSKTLSMGADAVLQKPFENEQLEALLETWFTEPSPG
ncbi:response regulator [Teredinibacter haidensis]|uniref:response regulator n=1 Tax=Teredinibacter haidensis TaxID=2731755 RepID=UPI0009F8E7C7|nr:response regulator [Teredinibacter haidensis]